MEYTFSKVEIKFEDWLKGALNYIRTKKFGHN